MAECPTCARPLTLATGTCLYCGRTPDPAGSAPSRSPASTAPPGGQFERKNRVFRAAFVIVALALGGGIVAWFWPEDVELDAALVARFAPAMASYAGEFPPGGDGAAHVVGRLVPIEPTREVEVTRGFDAETAPLGLTTTWRLSDLYNALPSELVASSPDEVGTLARVSCVPVEDGDYVAEGADGEDVSTGTGYRWSCSVELVDLAARRQIFRQTFLGGPPVWSTLVNTDPNGDPIPTTGGDRYGPRPREEMVEFLSSLPRR